MKTFMTGATGFIGGVLARRLLDEGHDLHLLVRTPSKAKELEEAGATLHQGDLTDPGSLAAGMEGADLVVHAAAWYEIGPIDRERMTRVNVDGTRHVLTAARDAEVDEVVYVSTIAAKGDTGGEVADEGFEHRGAFTTWYEWTKWKAHEVAAELRAEGLPLKVVMPGVVYGPGDHSAVGQYIADYVNRSLPARIGEDVVHSFVYVDDVAEGIVRVIERGEVGEEYLLPGFPYSYGELNRTLQDLTGVRPPVFRLPISLAKVYARLSEAFGRLTGRKVLVTREGIAMMDGVTYAFSAMKAMEQLGWIPRKLEDGLRPTLEAMGKAPR